MHKNIFWTQADIANSNYVKEITESIQKLGGADFVIHLAGFYDFTLKDGPEYEDTNVNGTLNILNLAKLLSVKRFIFASSLAACRFSDDFNTVVDENSPVDADFPYAHSKRKGEEMVMEFSGSFPCSIIRFAAIFSDWCEYPPLYKFLDTWLSKKWNSRIIGGKGETSITYLHISDLIKLLLRIIEITDKLPSSGIYVASPGGTVSHNDLFSSATRYFYGKGMRSFNMPKYLAVPGVMARTIIGKMIRKEPFECLWMMKYIDKKLIVENGETSKALNWEPIRRLDVLRRLLFMIEHKRNNPVEWSYRNEAMLTKIAYRPNIIMYDDLIELRTTLIDKMVVYLILSPDSRLRFPNFRKTDVKELKWIVTLFYQLMAMTIKSKDRQLIKNYTQIFTYRWYRNHYDIIEITDFLQTLVSIIKDMVISKNYQKKAKLEIYDYINIVLQLTIDEAEDYFELLKSVDAVAGEPTDKLTDVPVDEIQLFLKQVEETFYTANQNFPDLHISLQKNFRMILND